MRELGMPKWGTCGECRWMEEEEDDGMLCVRMPARTWTWWINAATVTTTHGWPTVRRRAHCGEWEPPEGRVCVNCEFVYERAEGVQACIVDESREVFTHQLRHPLDTCPAWRWSAPNDNP